MRLSARVVGIVAVVFVMSACGGSGGEGTGTQPARDAACQGSDCTDTSAPEAPLVCGGLIGTTCPQGYRCVDDPTDSCDPTSAADCGGICVLGEELPQCGGFTGAACADGYICVDDPNDDCAGGPAVDCPGICQPDRDGSCSTDDECPVLDSPCTVCADGSLSCPRSRCDAGECIVDFKACPEALVCGGISGLSCEPGFECVDDPTDSCVPEDGGADCRGICVPEQEPPTCGGVGGVVCPPGFECVDDSGDECDPSSGGADCPSHCEPIQPECTTDAECSGLDVPCSTCPDGTEACPRSVCENGQCIVSLPRCETRVICESDDTGCGPGDVCVDDLNDTCDPATGDVYCPGVCVPESAPRPCGGVVGETCPNGYECVDDSSDDCDPEVGGADCPGICAPVPPVECQADDECPRVLAPCTVCPDGTYACPRSECRDGVCTAVFDACAEPQRCGGVTGAPCAAGFTCVDDPQDECDPTAGGADCAGICVPAEPEECKADADCPALPVPCSLCPDGTTACPRPICEAGRCTLAIPTCPAPAGCSDDSECHPGDICVVDPDNTCDPTTGMSCAGKCVPGTAARPCGGIEGQTCPEGYQCVDDPGDDCQPDSGGADCPGTCEAVPPMECRADDECAHVLAPCTRCADGSYACPRGECRNGICTVVFDACATPGFCGGIAGFPCAPGYTCIDDPRDECDPATGGADCAGMCVREDEPPRCGGVTGEPCPAGYECTDDTRDDCDPANGGTDCPGVCKPAPSPECASDTDCPPIGAPCQLCADGTAACPYSFCDGGKCGAEFMTCGDEG